MVDSSFHSVLELICFLEFCFNMKIMHFVASELGPATAALVFSRFILPTLRKTMFRRMACAMSGNVHLINCVHGVGRRMPASTATIRRSRSCPDSMNAAGSEEPCVVSDEKMPPKASKSRLPTRVQLDLLGDALSRLISFTTAVPQEIHTRGHQAAGGDLMLLTACAAHAFLGSKLGTALCVDLHDHRFLVCIRGMVTPCCYWFTTMGCRSRTTVAPISSLCRPVPTLSALSFSSRLCCNRPHFG